MKKNEFRIEYKYGDIFRKTLRTIFTPELELVKILGWVQFKENAYFTFFDRYNYPKFDSLWEGTRRNVPTYSIFSHGLVLIDILECAEFKKSWMLISHFTKRSGPVYPTFRPDLVLPKILGYVGFEENLMFISHFMREIII